MKTEYGAIAIPLNRPDIVGFLNAGALTPVGVNLTIVGLRPTEAAELAWSRRLNGLSEPQMDDFLAIDHPHNNLCPVFTDRLVPIELLQDPGYLTRNMGGWSPIYFGVIELTGLEADIDDPVLKWLKVLDRYGPEVRFVGADPELVAFRFLDELGAELPTVVAAVGRLYSVRWQFASNRPAYIELLYRTMRDRTSLDNVDGPPFPKPLLLDELIGQLMRFEMDRRTALANGDLARAGTIAGLQAHWEEQFRFKFILKGEYIAGRHRGSIVLIAPELGVVVKQPAPEPLHEIKLNAVNLNGRSENWPYTTGTGALVTPRGRLRLVIEEDLVPRLSRVLDHRIELLTSVGLSVETFVSGKTVQELAWSDPGQLTPELYDEIVLNQQVCELLGGENGDWHSANFVVREDDGAVVHIDWGAARPLRADEHDPDARLARLNQVQNLAYSFHDPDLAALVRHHHLQLLADEERMFRVQQRARTLVDSTGYRDTKR